MSMWDKLILAGARPEAAIVSAPDRLRPTGSGDLRRSDFAGASERLEHLAVALKPAWIGFVGKEAYRGTFA